MKAGYHRESEVAIVTSSKFHLISLNEMGSVDSDKGTDIDVEGDSRDNCGGKRWGNGNPSLQDYGIDLLVDEAGSMRLFRLL
jgi:hypothetical protein